MKPEICKLAKFWEDAVKSYHSMRILLKEKKFEEAEKIANSAWISGAYAAIRLAYELKDSNLSVIAENIFIDAFENKETHYMPQEKIEWTQQAIKRLSDALPPDTFSPIE